MLRQAFMFTVLMTAFTDVYNHFVDSGPQVFHFGFDIVKYALTGIFAGYMGWESQESNYKRAQINGRSQPLL